MTTKYQYNPKTMTYEEVKNRIVWSTVISKILIILAVGYFIIGYALVLFELLELQNYINISAIVGGLASTVGVLSLFSPRIQKNDLDRIGIEYMEEVVKASKKLEEKDNEIKTREKVLGKREKEIQELELKKAELELLVQKASLTIFLNDQKIRVEEQIVKRIEMDKETIILLDERQKTVQQILDLGEELKKGEHSEQVQDLVEMINNLRTPSSPPKSFGESLIKSLYISLLH